MPVVWLASYPKSGNTWFRAFLHALSSPNSIDINAIDAGEWGPSANLFEDIIGLPFDELPSEERRRFRSAVIEQLARESESTIFWKTHEIFQLERDRCASFGRRSSARVIYLVRDPRDVACSYAHHLGESLDDTIDRMSSPDHCSRFKRGGLVIEEPMGTWSQHVMSWLMQTRLPVHRIRFEDLLCDPVREFSKSLSFAGLEYSASEVSEAVNTTQFEMLQAQELKAKFHERPQTSVAFFRSGKSGGWRNELSVAQVTSIETEHAHAMRSLGYDNFEGCTIGGTRD